MAEKKGAGYEPSHHLQTFTAYGGVFEFVKVSGGIRRGIREKQKTPLFHTETDRFMQMDGGKGQSSGEGGVSRVQGRGE